MNWGNHLLKNVCISTGIEGFDTILGGGLPSYQLYLVQGASGSGKTTLSLQFLLEGARQGETVLYIGTSETEEEIRTIASSHHWSLKGIDLFHHEGRQEPELTDQTVIYPAEVELPRTMDTLLSTVEKIQPDRLVIDSLTEIRLMAREEYWYWNQLLLLKRFFRDRDCTVLLTEIPTAEPFSAIHSIVHGKIELYQSSPGYGADRRHIRVNKLQGMDFVTGYHDYRIVTGGLICYPRLVAAEFRYSFEPAVVSTGDEDIDSFLGGGLDKGTSILLTGQSGTGKSLFATQCAVAAAKRGETVSMYIFDERIHTLLQRASAVGLDLAQYHEQGVIRIRQIDPAELTPGEFSFIVKQEIEEGVSMVILDSLNGYIYAMPEERFLTVHLHELSSYLNQLEVTTIFIASQQRLLHERASTAFDISYVADTVIQHSYIRVKGSQRKAISVFKRRSGTHDVQTRELTITERGIVLGEPFID
jgi:circadian clock protein KaiC